MKAIIFYSLIILFLGCQTSEKKPLAANVVENSKASKVSPAANRTLTEAFKKYWYAGVAEITSYELKQARYGEIREGHAVMVFVTEDFLPSKQVKADRFSEDNIPVLKLNSTKKFLTGIYPYSMITSTFNPVNKKDHALKVSHSTQEWCGHVYMQLNNKREFEIESHSYFESEGDQELKLEKTWLEDELWNLVRINPEELPTGDLQVLPSFESIRLKHQETKAQPAHGLLKHGENLSHYTLDYPSVKRKLTIYFKSNFPFEIQKWEEVHPNGLITTGAIKKRILSAYWGKNSNQDLELRNELDLD